MSIQFAGDCLRVLSHSLLAVKPQEGCALLIGNEKQSSYFHEENVWQIKLIWPCCNAWNIKALNFPTPMKIINIKHENKISKENRFAIDPREQIHAQRWARKKNMQILGSAHSHPNGEAFPSLIDQSWSFDSGLSVILGKSGNMRAWWITKNQTVPPAEVAILGLK